MLSRNEYRGKLSYDDYVKRYNLHKKALPKSNTDLPDTDIPPTQEEIKKYIEENKNNLTEKTKQMMKEQIEKKTGGKFKDLEDAINELQSETDNTEEGKEHREHMMKGIQLGRALQPNTESLTAKETVRAKLSQASKLGYMNDDNFRTAQEYLNGMGDTNGYTIDTQLSNKEGLVIRTPEGTTEIHYRGSQILDKPSLSDMKTNFKIATGFENEDAQFIQAKGQYEGAVNKYGSVEQFGGFSKGGGKALYMGQKYDIPSTTFNPFIGTRTARGITNTTQEHTIIRTTGDSPSLGLAVSTNANHENWNVKALRPLNKNVSLNPIKNLYDAHKLDNFTTPRNTGNVSNDPTTIENLMIKQGVLMGQKGKYETLDTMSKAVESGKTYSEFIQDLQKVGHRGDNDVGLVNGKPLIKGGRHTRGSMNGTADFWELMGGKFTPEEEQIISSNVVEPITNVEQAERFLEDFNQDGSEIVKQSPLQKVKDRANELKGKIDRLTENVKGASAKKQFVSPPSTDFEIEPELNKFINRQDLDVKPTPQEVRIKETQEDEFAKIEREQKPPAEIEPTSVPDSDVVDMPSMKLTQEQLETFGNASPQERQNIMNNHNEEIINTTHELGEAFAPVEASGFREHFGEAINPVSMGAGMLVGMGVDSALDYIDPAGKDQKITGVSREALAGGLTGAGMFGGTTALGGATIGLAPEILAGSVGYVAGSESGKLIGKGIKKLGGGEDAQEAGSDIGGGAIGGGAGALALIGGGALTGAEMGSFAGPLGIGIGVGVGVVGGTLGFGVSEIVKHKDDIKKGITNAGNAIGNTAKSVGKSVGHFFKSIF
tara:strand:+ start:6671 stop:9154 length:2484 start_codon:yes stop_codon:yes gene_type:complete